MITKSAQPSKSLFNVKKARLFHSAIPLIKTENGTLEKTSKPEGFRTFDISVQTLNEATNTLRRKTKLPLDDIKTLIAVSRGLVTIHPITEAVYSRGWAIIERYGLQTYDSMILACAIENGIETLLSEDMQSGQQIFDMVTIINPFQKT